MFTPDLRPDRHLPQGLGTSRDHEKKENPQTTPGIFEETDALKAAAVWGPVGAEAVLVQLFPPRISLFSAHMSVPVARQEGLNFAKTLASLGVNTTVARDLLAAKVNRPGLSFDTVVGEILQKGRQVQQEYGLTPPFDWKGVVVELIEKDRDRYGTQQAAALNWLLSLSSQLPVANMVYARDQMNVLLQTRIAASMKKDVRKPEVVLYEELYLGLFPGSRVVKIPDNESFEGGDAYVHDKTVFVGVGARTSLGGALAIYSALEGQLNEFGYEFVLVVDEHVLQRPEIEQMDFMHLDTFSNPIGKKQMVICETEATKRKVFLVNRANGQVSITDTGKNFAQFLVSRGEQLVVLTPNEQQGFGCNFLTLDENTILLPSTANDGTRQKLEKAGKIVHTIGLDQTTSGYGAAHCMTGQLIRRLKNT